MDEGCGDEIHYKFKGVEDAEGRKSKGVGEGILRWLRGLGREIYVSVFLQTKTPVFD